MFNISEVTGAGQIGESVGAASGSFSAKYLNAHYQKIEKLKKELGRLPEKEEIFFLQSDKSFNAFTFIPWICEITAIKHLYVATYSINKRVIGALVQLHAEGKIDRITLLVSDSMLKRNPQTCDLLAAQSLQYGNIQVLFAWSHAKVSLIDTGSGKFVLEGSGNWSENAAYEQYIFANSPKAFEFRKKLFTETDIRWISKNGINQKHQ